MASLLEHCRGLPQVRFAAGATVLEEGAAAGVLYVLTDGAVEIVKGAVQITAVAEPGALFGETRRRRCARSSRDCPSTPRGGCAPKSDRDI